jgi:hypothetical protein
MTPTELRYLVSMVYGMIATLNVVVAVPSEYVSPAAWGAAALWIVLGAAYVLWLVTNRRLRNRAVGRAAAPHGMSDAVRPEEAGVR